MSTNMSNISPLGATAQQPAATLPPGYVAPPSSSSSNAGTLNSVNANTFLQLLVSELQNQNPNNPANPSQFLTQTATFEEVQQLTSLQTSMTNLVTAQQNTSATSLLGMQVTGADSAGKSVSGTVDGVELTSGGPVLSVNGSKVSYSSVTEVSQPPTGTSSTGTSSTSSISSTGTSSTS